jgi:DNA-binding NarL/FixJ family response regulator
MTFAEKNIIPMIKVAIVDDKQINRTTLQEKLLSKNNIEVLFTACNGEEFLEKMKESPILPDIVFMDIDMPVMNGIEAVNSASEIYPDTKFLMLTVFDDDEKIFEAIKAGAVGYLLKDENPDRLINALYEVVEYGGAPMSPRIARKSLQLLSKSKFVNNKSEESFLTEREMDILKGLVEGKDYRELANEINLSPNTVRTHISKIYKKLHVNNKTQAIKIAMKKRWFGILL